MPKKYTHTGQLLGDARTGDKSPTVKLRETANFWVSDTGRKYRKSDGWPPGEDWPVYSLIIGSIKPIE